MLPFPPWSGSVVFVRVKKKRKSPAGLSGRTFTSYISLQPSNLLPLTSNLLPLFLLTLIGVAWGKAML